MQLPNVIECDKWLFEYSTEDNSYYGESYSWAPKALTRDEAMQWFKDNFDHTPIKCLCIGKSRIRV